MLQPRFVAVIGRVLTEYVGLKQFSFYFLGEVELITTVGLYRKICEVNLLYTILVKKNGKDGLKYWKSRSDTFLKGRFTWPVPYYSCNQKYSLLRATNTYNSCC